MLLLVEGCSVTVILDTVDLVSELFYQQVCGLRLQVLNALDKKYVVGIRVLHYIPVGVRFPTDYPSGRACTAARQEERGFASDAVRSFWFEGDCRRFRRRLCWCAPKGVKSVRNLCSISAETRLGCYDPVIERAGCMHLEPSNSACIFAPGRRS